MRRRRDDYFADKLALITGGTSGIGLALAEELSRLKARIIVLADKADTVASAVAQLGGAERGVHGYVCDIGSVESVRDACGRILASHGAPDILINNAGFAIYRTFHQEHPDEVERLMEVNFNGAVRVTKVFLDEMVKRRSGHIVNIASISGMLPLTPNAVYGAAKHGMMGWSRCIAPELARFGIDITVICPGRVKTNFFQHETYHTRLHRKETELTIPMQTVIDATLDAILRRKFIRYVPRYYGFLAWAYHAFGPLVQRPFDKLMRSRVADIYRNPGPS
jgi:NAD(P)-dependent dehydrogenase (short-subunit alcohol dehydrogenase family)